MGEILAWRETREDTPRERVGVFYFALTISLVCKQNKLCLQAQLKLPLFSTLVSRVFRVSSVRVGLARAFVSRRN